MAVKSLCLLGVILICGTLSRAHAQSSITAGTITGVVADARGAVVAGAKIELDNLLTRFKQAAVTDEAGRLRLTNIPFNNYQLRVTASGFAPLQIAVEVRTVVPVELKLPPLGASAVTETVNILVTSTRGGMWATGMRSTADSNARVNEYRGARWIRAPIHRELSAIH
jgi:hypothetical protein